MTENRLVSLEVLYDRTDWCHWKCCDREQTGVTGSVVTENRLVSLEVLYDREQTGVTGSVV